MRHIISVLVENRPGVLARIAGLFSARGFNIESLAVGETEDPGKSRMTIAVGGDDAILEQVRKQLEKLIDTIRVTDYPEGTFIERDYMLVKVRVASAKRGEVAELVRMLDGRVADVSEKAMILEIGGDEAKVESFLTLLRPYGIAEIVRTGRIAMKRGE